MASIEKLAGMKSGPETEIQTASANVRVAPEGTRTDDRKLIVPAIGDVNGVGNVSPANELHFRMSATVHASGLLALAGNTQIPFIVQGTCDRHQRGLNDAGMDLAIPRAKRTCRQQQSEDDAHSFRSIASTQAGFREDRRAYRGWR